MAFVIISPVACARIRANVVGGVVSALERGYACIIRFVRRIIVSFASMAFSSDTCSAGRFRRRRAHELCEGVPQLERIGAPPSRDQIAHE